MLMISFYYVCVELFNFNWTVDLPEPFFFPNVIFCDDEELPFGFAIVIFFI